jgi:hypothetical protein
VSAPTSFRLPFVLPDDVHPMVAQALRYAFSGLDDLNQAIANLVPKVNANTKTIMATSALSQVAGGSAPSGSSIGIVNQQSTGAYSLVAGDFGALLILESAATFAVSLTSTIAAPFYVVIENQCLGLATLTPTTGQINNLSSWLIPVGQFALVFFDGTNWWATTIPPFAQTFSFVPHYFLTSYNAASGAFTAARPGASDLMDSTVGSGPVVLDSGASLYSPKLYSTMSIKNLQVFANNGAAVAAGLVAGNLYRDGSDPDHVCVTH